MKNILLLLALVGEFAYGQSSYKENQRKLDLNHTGIGFELVRPNFGSRIMTEQRWFGFNFLADVLDARFSFGEVLLSEPVLGFTDGKPAPVYANRYTYGANYYIGALFPISGLRVGNQVSSLNVKRIHPVLGIGFGGTTFKQKSNQNIKDAFYYLGVNVGARLRLPIITIEPNISFNVGIHTGDNYDAFKWYSIMPSLIFRFEGRKQYLDPSLVTVGMQQVSVSNYRSKSYESTYYRSDGTRMKRTTTYSSADVKVTPGSVGIQDIGPFAGVGLKYSMNGIRKTDYLPRGQMFGGVLHIKGGPLYTGFTMEGGRIGHGSEIDNSKSWFKKVENNEDYAPGTYNNFQTFFDIGMDISPALLSVLGMVREETSATSYSSVIAGYSFGYAAVFNQQFDNETTALNELDRINELTKYNDPRLGKGGFMGGWFLGIEIGVLSFKAQAYKYRNAPLANNTFYSLAYRIPITGR